MSSNKRNKCKKCQRTGLNTPEKLSKTINYFFRSFAFSHKTAIYIIQILTNQRPSKYTLHAFLLDVVILHVCLIKARLTIKI